MAIYRDWDLALDVEQVLSGQGIDAATARTRRPALVEAARWALAEGLPLLEPVVQAETYRVDTIRHARVQFVGGGSLSGPLVSQHLAGAERVTLILCTLGSQMETVAGEVLRSDPVLGLALDGLGSAAIEALAAQACSRFESNALAEGLNSSIPLSPGMLGWPVDTGQRQIFQLLDAAAVGVRLTSGDMMIPVKSLTQVLGFGPGLAPQGRTCDFCSLKDTCRYQEHYAKGPAGYGPQ